MQTSTIDYSSRRINLANVRLPDLDAPLGTLDVLGITWINGEKLVLKPIFSHWYNAGLFTFYRPIGLIFEHSMCIGVVNISIDKFFSDKRSIAP